MSSKDLLATLLGSTTTEKFFEEFWQQKPLHVERNDATFYKDIFDPTSGDMEQLWCNAMPLDDGTLMYFQGVGEQVKLPSPFFAFPHRCSVVVNKGDRCSTALLELCQGLQTRFPFVYTNIYQTPSNSQSVPRHSDDREVLMLQVYGSKQWTVYDDPVRLPYKDEEVGKRSSQTTSSLNTLIECTLKQGDLMYLPRGFVHEGAAGTEPSMHITVALQSSDWDYRCAAMSVLAEALRSLPEARDCLPPSVLAGQPGNDARSSEKFDRVVAESVAAARGKYSLAVEEFQERLEQLRIERDQVAAKIIKPPPFVVTVHTQMIWNPIVHLERVTKAKDAKVVSVEHVAHFKRKGSDGNWMRMSLAVSDEVMKNIALLQEKYVDVPVQVGALLMHDTLSKIALAYFLLNNESCILVK